MTELFSKSRGENYITIVTMLMHPFSRGNIHITSSDPTEQSNSDPRYLSHSMDIEMLARALLFVRKIAKTEPLASMLKPNRRQIPPVKTEAPESPETRKQVPLDDDLEYSRRVAHQRLFTAFHPSGTCAMRPREQGGIVDSHLRVNGSANIRVVNASVFPLKISRPLAIHRLRRCGKSRRSDKGRPGQMLERRWVLGCEHRGFPDTHNYRRS